MTKTKIDWCDYTWNPVWGCLNNCPYCYARKLAKRFGDPDFKPTWKQKNFDKSFPQKPSRIFVNSMSDICSWNRSWTMRVLKKIEVNPMHAFLFLTKKPDRVYDILDYLATENCWFGTTITKNDFPAIPLSPDHINFVSLEPILESIDLRKRTIIQKPLDWVIIGAETGNRKGKIIPKREWITEIVDYCRGVNIPVFLKESLREIWGEELIQEYPLQSRVIGG